jgi:hypothetical protein
MRSSATTGTDEEFHDNRPEPAAVCGEVITLASMETPPGPRCVQCAAFLTAREELRDVGQRVDPHRRLSWLDRLLHPNFPTSASQSAHALVRDGRLQPPVVTPAGGRA